MAAVLFVSTAYNRASAQTVIHPTEQSDNTSRHTVGFPLGKIAMPDSAKYQTITGAVVGDDDHLPLPGVSVFIENSKVGTQTNNDGTFSIRVPVSTKTITFSYLGYERQVIKLKKINKSGTIQLKLKPMVTGEVSITKYSILRQLYTQLVNIPGRRKLNREI